MMVKQEKISGPFQATLFTVITMNPELNCTCREASRTTLDVMLERRMDVRWNIEGNRDLSDSRTGFTRFTIMNEKPFQGPVSG